MTTYFISRHPGALEWAKQHHIHYDVHYPHLSRLDFLMEGDVVIGSLPINLVYILNLQGVRYQHLSLVIPQELRGVELSAQQLQQCQAKLEEFQVTKVNNN